jgi:hypothetical protein
MNLLLFLFELEGNCNLKVGDTVSHVGGVGLLGGCWQTIGRTFVETLYL